jgi:Protein of unknown function (DUF3606)
MSNERKNLGSPDRRLISLKDPADVSAWCKTLDCTEAELRSAVLRVGHAASKVKVALAKRKQR